MNAFTFLPRKNHKNPPNKLIKIFTQDLITSINSKNDKRKVEVKPPFLASTGLIYIDRRQKKLIDL